MSGTTQEFAGWDLGGAHLKVARVGADGRVKSVDQFATPLWEGLAGLESALVRLGEDFGPAPVCHAVTMTGELVDSFVDRKQGVRALLELFSRCFPHRLVFVYAVGEGIQPLSRIQETPQLAASANWHASGTYVASSLDDGILVDIGSTTTDIVPFQQRALCSLGATDQERLRHDELVYTGIVRTPVMALIRRAPFAGAWQNIAAERFATLADVYRVTGELDERWDLYPPADGAGKGRFDSIRRLARMLGTDAEPGDAEAHWQALAGFIAARQMDLISGAYERVGSRVFGVKRDVKLVGAGCGRFLVRKLARLHGHEYVDFDNLVQMEPEVHSMGSACATAIAVAQLARRGFRQ